MYLQTQYLDNLNTDGWNPNTSTDRAPRPLQGALSCAVLSRGEPFPSLLPQLRPTGGGAAVETILPMTLGARWRFCIGQRNGVTGIVMHVRARLGYFTTPLDTVEANPNPNTDACRYTLL